MNISIASFLASASMPEPQAQISSLPDNFEPDLVPSFETSVPLVLVIVSSSGVNFVEAN